jgi:RND family efflux transporter MFP subunit
VPKKQHYILFSLAVLGASLVNGCTNDKETLLSNRPPLPVELSTLETKNLIDATEYVGTLESKETINLVPQINGQLTKILVNSGAQVKKGQLLFTIAPDQAVPIYKSNLETVQLNVEGKKLAIANLETARANLETNIANLSVAEQQVPAKRSLLDAAKSQYNLAKYENHATQYLFQKKVAPELKAQTTESQEEVAKENVISAQKELDAAIQQVAVAKGQIAAAKAQVAAAQSNVGKADAGIKQAQAQANAAKVNVSFKNVTSPIDGTVGNVALRVGSVVNTTSTILTTINRNDAFDLQIPVPINRASQLRKGLSVQLLDPTTGDELATGNLYFVSPTTSANTQVILTRANFLNPNGKLRNAQYVKARIIWKTQPGVLVPAMAVTTIGPQNFVYVPQEKKVGEQTQMLAQQLPVTLGPIQGQSYQVVSGLKAGDKIIVSNILKLTNGSPISPQKSNTAANKTSLRLPHSPTLKV